jgi:hypothetical protein
MMRFRLALATLVCVCAGLAAEAAPAVDKGVHKNRAEPTVERLFLQRNSRTMAILQMDFPRDHDAIMASIALLEHAELPVERKLELLFVQLKDIRNRYAERLRFAPEPNQQLVMAVLGGFMLEVEREVGTATCGMFARDGTGALFEAGVAGRFAAAIDSQSAAYLAAIVASIENPEIHEPIQQADWSAVFAQMGRLGHPLSYVESIAKGAVEDPDLCPALGSMFRTAALMPGINAARFRADFVSKLAGY